ncbi:fibronectin type III domain-containing protein [Hymenobacter jeollabukensis]|uniref:Fibronectin type-III domain-containing protein n=1 Tax=Hymenobacter jeollabukensis TaxID=2025313 RepID=A0A5R8WNL8_9BACT|nr:fibronectin type III domain-containing protein [Hymenobacter jeollabukensis]TLM91236.1 hypothetical protein FDY95_16735 [Hymenobacter jeollabukensis]
MKKLTLLALLLSSALMTARAQQTRTTKRTTTTTTTTKAPATPAAPAAPAGPPTLASVRTTEPGATVTVRGVVVNGPELGNIRYIQDKEGGLGLFSNTLEDLKNLMPGDSVEAHGVLKNYNSLLEMDPVQSVKKLASGRKFGAVTVPAAELTKVLSEAYEGRLVKITEVERLSTTGGQPAPALVGNVNYLINGQAGAIVRISAPSTGPNGLVGFTPPEGKFDLVGVVGQHSPTGTPTGYQLLPRLSTDFVVAGGLPVIKGEPVPVAVTKNSITVDFSTINPGTTKIEYGASPALGGVVEDKTPVTQHQMTLTDLQAGTTYYIRVSSGNSMGISTQPAVPMITRKK